MSRKEGFGKQPGTRKSFARIPFSLKAVPKAVLKAVLKAPLKAVLKAMLKAELPPPFCQ